MSTSLPSAQDPIADEHTSESSVWGVQAALPKRVLYDDAATGTISYIDLSEWAGSMVVLQSSAVLRWLHVGGTAGSPSPTPTLVATETDLTPPVADTVMDRQPADMPVSYAVPRLRPILAYASSGGVWISRR